MERVGEGGRGAGYYNYTKQGICANNKQQHSWYQHSENNIHILGHKVVSTWVVGEDGYYVSGSVWKMVNKWTQLTHITIKGQIQKELMGETSHIDWSVSQVDWQHTLKWISKRAYKIPSIQIKYGMC